MWRWQTYSIRRQQVSELVGREEACRQLGVKSPQTLVRWLKKGRVRPSSIMQSGPHAPWLVDVEAVREDLARNTGRKGKRWPRG